MKILLTGASGFLGSVILERFKSEGLETICLGRSAINDIQLDLVGSDVVLLPRVEMVVHAAGKAHIVPKTAAEKQDFYTVNVEGTKHLLEALEGNTELKKFVFISSVAVYGREEGIAINEDNPLLAKDPYGESKIKAEALVAAWCSAHGVAYYILRLPLIAGKNAPGNLGAMMRGIERGRYLSIGKATAKKSMVLATDIAELISYIDGPAGIYNLTDGYHPSFGELEAMICGYYQKKRVLGLPMIGARVLGFVGDMLGSRFPVNSRTIKKITSTLCFDDSRARELLHWKPREVLRGF
jgi:nucleoside-diphosphate-sugar epimerase